MQADPKAGSRGEASPRGGVPSLAPGAPPAFSGHDLRLTFPSSPLSVRRALQTVVKDLDELELEERGTLELVLAEVLNNVAEHAYGNEERGWISLECARDPHGLAFRIRDEGQPMPEGLPPMGDPAPLPETLDAMPEGGFGWFLIRDLARDLQYTRKGDVNELSFRMRIGGAADSALPAGRHTVPTTPPSGAGQQPPTPQSS